MGLDEKLFGFVRRKLLELVRPREDGSGRVALDEIDSDLMLRRRPGTFVAGEMIDWEAPTGGYLIAMDAIGAGMGETVLILDEGSGALQHVV